ncbi:MAG: hypothetical protein H2069_08390 [Legionella sp.]|nr:hypothetical protein [Legionella sp.]
MKRNDQEQVGGFLQEGMEELDANIINGHIEEYIKYVRGKLDSPKLILDLDKKEAQEARLLALKTMLANVPNIARSQDRKAINEFLSAFQKLIDNQSQQLRDIKERFRGFSNADPKSAEKRFTFKIMDSLTDYIDEETFEQIKPSIYAHRSNFANRYPALAKAHNKIKEHFHKQVNSRFNEADNYYIKDNSDRPGSEKEEALKLLLDLKEIARSYMGYLATKADRVQYIITEDLADIAKRNENSKIPTRDKQEEVNNRMAAIGDLLEAIKLLEREPAKLDFDAQALLTSCVTRCKKYNTLPENKKFQGFTKLKQFFSKEPELSSEEKYQKILADSINDLPLQKNVAMQPK